MKDLKPQKWTEITVIETESAIKKTQNWKAPGHDKVVNFWIKYLTSIHDDLTLAYSDIIKKPEHCPGWLTWGTTYLIPKLTSTNNPKNYRPITCLPTMYKILTSIIANRIYKHLEQNLLIPQEQKGCRRGSYGCKDQLLINEMILEEVKVRKKIF